MSAPTSSSSVPTVLGYSIREHIASGGMSQVYRALNPITNHLVAIKVIPLDSKAVNAEAEGKKVVREIRIHEVLKHASILQLIGGESREGRGIWPEGLYIVLDLASGGDLFDKIAPDCGVDEDVAHLYFRQLMAGLKYLGKQGICHRDIKPENCLLDGDANLKISDFGLASVFKYKGRSRLLQERCGSPPYAAPELAQPAPYAGEPVDVWSAGILLFALLVGNTPWDEPTSNAPEFVAFIKGAHLTMDPWNRIGGSAMGLLQRLLTVDPAKRITIQEMESIDWYRQSNPLIAADGSCADGALVCSRLFAGLRRQGHLGAPEPLYEEAMTLHSQGPSAAGASQVLYSQMGLDPTASFYSSARLYSRLSMAPSQRTNPHISRFFSTTTLFNLITTFEAIFLSLSIPLAKTIISEDESEARVRFRHRDKRGEKLIGMIRISPSVLPSEQGNGSMAMEEGDDEGTSGFDVVLLKKEADPLELKRLWAQVMSKLPAGIVFAT